MFLFVIFIIMATLDITALDATKQGRIHGNLVAEGGAGAVMQKPLELKNVTYVPTDTVRCRVACPRPKSGDSLPNDSV